MSVNYYCAQLENITKDIPLLVKIMKIKVIVINILQTDTEKIKGLAYNTKAPVSRGFCVLWIWCICQFLRECFANHAPEFELPVLHLSPRRRAIQFGVPTFG